MQHGVCTSQWNARVQDTIHARRRKMIKFPPCSNSRPTSKESKTLIQKIPMRNESQGGLQCL